MQTNYLFLDNTTDNKTYVNHILFTSDTLGYLIFKVHFDTYTLESPVHLRNGRYGPRTRRFVDGSKFDVYEI